MQSLSIRRKHIFFGLRFFVSLHFGSRIEIIRVYYCVCVVYLCCRTRFIYPIMRIRSYFCTNPIPCAFYQIWSFRETAYFYNNNLPAVYARFTITRVLILFHIRDYCYIISFLRGFITFIDRPVALMRITVYSTFITAIYFLIYLIHLRFQSRIILFPQSPFHFSWFGHRQSFISASYLLSYFIQAIYFNKLPR